ncbi:hypothetical protein PG993_005641 [Apiospora rasikravindrae]|uniref:Uncharacterized protein n=1 Tax=Apiospora rasikravindrae TaxID=990691 RepID=A0ABR1TG73_9PEZI
MFLHSGASLHGHEYSNKSSQPAGQAGARRNHLLRSTFTAPFIPRQEPPPPSILRVNGRPIARRAPSTPEPVVRFQEPAADRPPPVNRASTISYNKTDPQFPPPLPPRSIASAATRVTTTTSSLTLTHSKGKPSLFRRVSGTPEPTVKFQEPAAEHELRSGSREDTMMSGDEGSVYISDSETSHAGSSARRSARRVSSRSSTAYLLAQPAPKLNQRLLHIRPQLLLQTQQVSANKRPKPTIDVYPSSAIAHSALVTPLFKRFPRLARIKRELSVGDIMLVQSEDLSAPAGEHALDEDDEDSINKRDLVAILSPMGRDMAEIVLSDGTVWTAKPRIQGSVVSYDFTTEDESGKITTARWARRKATSKPAATSAPTSPTASFSSAPEHRFTFSMIDPSCRRHPIMATLRPNQLEVQDTYTTVSQSAGRYPPTSSALGSPTTPTGQTEDAPAPSPERTVQTVEDWQKTLAQVTALWVVLHQGWVSSFRPMNIECRASTTGTNNPSKLSQQTRSFSFGSNGGRSPSQGQATKGSNPLHRITRRVGTTGSQQTQGERESKTKTEDVLGALPRRATSTGAAYMQKRNAQNRLSMESPPSEDSELLRRGPSPFNGVDWNGSTITNRSCEQQPTTPSSTLSRPKRHSLNRDDYSSYPPADSSGASLAPEPLPQGHRRVVSEYYYGTPWRVSSPLGLDEETGEEKQDPFETHASGGGGGFKQPVVVSNESGADDGINASCGTELARGRPRTPKRRSMLNWFTRLRGQ